MPLLNGMTAPLRTMRHGLRLAGLLALLVPIALSVAGCETSSGRPGPVASVGAPGQVAPVAAASQPGVITSEFTSQGTVTPPSGQNYRIGVGDILSISVFQVPDLTSNNTQVSGEGTISMPLIGTIRAAGLNPRQLEGVIAGKLKAKYLQSPQVTVDVSQFNSQRYTVEGAVTRPGVFPITGGDASLLRAVATAGGFDRVADTSNVVIFRMKGNQKVAARFDVSQIRSGASPDPEVLSGDVIVVDTSGVRSTLRDVLQVLPVAGLFMAVL